MATACMYPAPCVTTHCGTAIRAPALHFWQRLARLGALASRGVYAWRHIRRQTEALHTMNTHQLQDVGAPHWLLQRAASREALDCYEHHKAMTRVRY